MNPIKKYRKIESNNKEKINKHFKEIQEKGWKKYIGVPETWDG